MKKKVLMTILIMSLVTAGAFAQNKNIITVDLGPTIIGLTWNFMGNWVGGHLGMADTSSSGFGIAAQYERQLHNRFSVAGRFSYLGMGAGLSLSEGGATASLGIDIKRFAFEGHFRVYPAGRSFFIDAMAGYTLMIPSFSGHVIVNESGIYASNSIDFSVRKSYFSYGGKLGWRIDFGRPGGFIMELSLGWNGSVGIGDSIGQKVSNEMGQDAVGIDQGFRLLEKYIFAGGPRGTLAFGWRF